MHIPKFATAGVLVLYLRLSSADDTPPSSGTELDGLTYWIDQSCLIDQYPNEYRATRFQNALGEAIHFAARAHTRLEDPTDQLAEAYSQRIFKASQNHDSTKMPKEIVAGIEEMESTNNHGQSTIRFYCDNDNYGPGTRWTLVPDIIVPEGQPQPVRNSQKTLGVDQEWEDTINGIRRGEDTLGCQDEWTFGETYFKTNNDPRYANQNKFRTTITLCDLPLSRDIQATTNIPLEVDLSGISAVQEIGSVLSSITLLHELTHWEPWRVDDMSLEDGSTAIDWEPLQTLDNQDAVRNADSFAYFGLLAVLADRGFRLSPDDEEARIGTLVLI